MRSLARSAARSRFYNTAWWQNRTTTSGPRRWTSSHPSLRQWSTPLAKHLAEAITATGPIPLASFMRMCMTSDLGGYYTSQQEGRDQFGQKGDFITSPEISQMFGELLGIWFVAEWIAQGKKSSGVVLLEVGPGRGTLMDDMLRTIRNFKPMASSIEAIYLVEASPSLREAQKELLCGDAPMTETSNGCFSSISKYGGLPVIWTDHIRFVPSDPSQTPFIVAHEFFDALPIHAFQYVRPSEIKAGTISTPTGEHSLSPEAASRLPNKNQWLEMVVSPTPLSVKKNSNGINHQQPANLEPDFQLTLSRSPTPESGILPRRSKRYAALKRQPSALIEISPDSQLYAREFARRIGGSSKSPKPCPSGAALILDYGPLDTVPANSLRGIREHQRVSPFSSPGLVDLSADVDFLALAEAALSSSEGIEVHGPVEQGYFLLQMGIKERAEMLLKNSVTDEEVKKRVESAWKRLVDRGGSGMGKVYKAMAILPEDGGKRRPVGFGGDVMA